MKSGQKGAHTPGPWVVLSDDAVQLGTDIIINASNNNYRMGTANARLIAASPDLLAAAEAVSREAGQMDAHTKPPVYISHDLIIALRAAIARAEAV